MVTGNKVFLLNDFWAMLLIILLLAIGFFIIKRLLKDSIRGKITADRYKSLKFSNVECNVYASEPFDPIETGKIVFNENAPNKVGIVFRFGCAPCMSRMDEIIETIEKRNDVSIEFIFNTWQKHLKEELPLMLYFASLYADSPLKFLGELKKYTKNYPLSKKKYTLLWGNPDSIDANVKTLVSSHIAWCTKYDIKQTPSHLLNNRIVSYHYNFNDLMEIIINI